MGHAARHQLAVAEAPPPVRAPHEARGRQALHDDVAGHHAPRAARLLPRPAEHVSRSKGAGGAGRGEAWAATVPNVRGWYAYPACTGTWGPGGKPPCASGTRTQRGRLARVARTYPTEAPGVRVSSGRGEARRGARRTCRSAGKGSSRWCTRARTTSDRRWTKRRHCTRPRACPACARLDG